MTKFKDYYGNNIEEELTADVTDHGLMSNDDKVKLDGIEAGANKYVQPSSFPASMITQNSNNRFVTDAQIANWNVDKDTTYNNATGSVSGLMSAADKVKMDTMASGANNYTHPSTHPATMIVEDTSHKFVTDAQITAWNAKAGTAVASTTVNGLMSAADKVKLDGIASGANAYTHPTTTGNKHIPAGGASGQILRWSADGTATWGADNNTTYSVATTTTNGLMSAADKVKLDGAASYTYGVSGNSHYKKHADGTLEMWGRFQLSYTNQLWASTLANSGISYSVPFTITFPVTAVGTVECNINIESINVSWASIQSITTTAIKYILVCGSPDKTYDAYIHWSAKGKWK